MYIHNLTPDDCLPEGTVEINIIIWDSVKEELVTEFFINFHRNRTIRELARQTPYKGEISVRGLHTNRKLLVLDQISR